jgi:hypothetical protein
MSCIVMSVCMYSIVFRHHTGEAEVLWALAPSWEVDPLLVLIISTLACETRVSPQWNSEKYRNTTKYHRTLRNSTLRC